MCDPDMNYAAGKQAKADERERVRDREPEKASDPQFGMLSAGGGQTMGMDRAFSGTIHYTPLFLTMCIELYVNPDAPNKYARYHKPCPQREGLDLLVRAGILKRTETGNGGLAGYPNVSYEVDQNALRVYVDALCRVPLPMQKWVMP